MEADGCSGGRAGEDGVREDAAPAEARDAGASAADAGRAAAGSEATGDVAAAGGDAAAAGWDDAAARDRREAGLRREVEELKWQLRKSKENADWWWQETRRLERRIADEPSAWRFCRVSSPLTKQEKWCTGITHEGWLWHAFEVSCPCCKRPLDVTVLRSDRPSGGGGAFVESAEDTPVCAKFRCVDLPPRCDKAPVFESLDSYGIISSVAMGDVVVAAGPPRAVEGYRMVPVQPRGAVDARFFEALCAEDSAPNGAIPTVPPALRLAYCAVIWGANGGYALGASVLGARLRELSAGARGGRTPDRVLLHTDDVPQNFLDVLAQVWTLRPISYIDGVEDLYSMKGTAFDGVFTKLAAWGLTDYDRVLLLDIDLVPLKAPLELFDLTPPAALIRGNSDLPHGTSVGGRRFFCGEADAPYTWGQGGGINAGVILLRPCRDTLAQMIREVTSEEHPEHIRGNGPEQDYLTRYFASAPWHHMDVRWNYQVHHMPFALEQVLNWRRYFLEADRWFSEAEHEWLPTRLKVELESIGIVHFSGDVKPWHVVLDAVQDSNQRRAVDHAPSSWRDLDVDAFVEHLLQRCCESYNRWMARTAPAAEYSELSCELLDGGRIELVVNTKDGSKREDVTALIDKLVQRIRSTTRMALEEWRNAADRFLQTAPEALEELRRPSVPEGCFAPGSRVEVLWPPPEESRENRYSKWLTAMVVSVHADGRHVVRFHHGGTWGDTERGVHLSRLRADPATQPEAA